ncbi:MAG TPA: hypothetical protein PLN21_08210 [Gemmatales bacterium]|nr:hypothetical protein [Gemmatales bacterium]
MKRYRKYRLAFDALALLGLLLLALYFWYGHPTPQWRVLQKSANTEALGFSPDNQKVYSIKDCSGINSPPRPVLQRWELATGTLEAEYPLKMPDDLSLIKPDMTGSPHYSYRVHLIQDNILYVETTLGIRFYDIQSGECLSWKNMPGGWIYYLLKNPADQHHWGIDGSRNESGKAVLYDLTTGDVLHAIERDPALTLHHCRVSADQRYLLLSWERKKEDKTSPPYELEIVELGTWKSLLRKPMEKPGGYDGIGHLLKSDLFVQDSYYKENGVSIKRLECFHFDLAKGTLEPDKSHPFHDFISKDWIFVRNEFLIQHGIRGQHQPILPTWKKLWNSAENLIRFGKLPEAAGQQDYLVYDFETGRLLRQLTGLTAFGHQALFLSSNARFLLGIEYLGEWNNSKQPPQQFWTLYEIPSVWWERWWSESLYLALILIVLWPARFLVRKPI